MRWTDNSAASTAGAARARLDFLDQLGRAFAKDDRCAFDSPRRDAHRLGGVL